MNSVLDIKHSASTHLEQRAVPGKRSNAKGSVRCCQSKVDVSVASGPGEHCSSNLKAVLYER